MTMRSRWTSPDIALASELTTSKPSCAMEACLWYCRTSFQYSPVYFPKALGGGLPDVSSFLVSQHAWFANWAFFQAFLLVYDAGWSSCLMALYLALFSKIDSVVSLRNLCIEQCSEVHSGGILD